MGSVLTFLLVDDDPAIRRLIKRMVRGNHVEWIEADTLDSAQQKYAENKATLRGIWTDVRLADGSGLEFALKLLSERQDLPVVILSGIKPEWPQEEPAKLFYLPKPFTKDRLVGVLNEVLRLAEAS